MKMNATRLAWLRVSIFLLALVPFVRLFVLGYNDGLGANPIEFVTRSTGIWTLVFLCITLAISPVRKLTGWAWLLRLRRMMGLYTFFYSVAHLTTYVWFDQWFEWAEIGKDILKRPYITAGFTAFILMVPLALTSNNWSMRRLGRRWASMHRLVYIAGLAAILHFWWHKASKNDLFEPTVYGVIVLALLGLRFYWRSAAARASVSAASKGSDQALSRR